MLGNVRAGLKVLFMVWVLLGILDTVLAVLEDPVQFPAPLAVKCAKNLEEDVFIVAKMAI